MRNDTTRWDPPPSLTHASDDLSLAEVSLPIQHWVSGLNVLEHFKNQLVSWPDIVTGDTYALTLRRDRVLLVGHTDLKPGYFAETGFAVTDISDGYAVMDVSGPSALAHLRHGAELNLDQPSRSVMRRAFGQEVMLYRVQNATTFRLHVPRAAAASVFRQLVG